MNRRSRTRGQGLAEFAIAIPVFLILLMAVVDFGMAIYKYNGVSQAAREIARATSVHPCAATNPCDPGSPPSPETAAVVATQKELIPGLGDPTFTCIDETGATVAPNPCDFSKDSIKVEITAPYTPVTPILGLAGTWTMKGSSSAQIQ